MGEKILIVHDGEVSSVKNPFPERISLDYFLINEGETRESIVKRLTGFEVYQYLWIFKDQYMFGRDYGSNEKYLRAMLSFGVLQKSIVITSNLDLQWLCRANNISIYNGTLDQYLASLKYSLPPQDL